MGTTTCAGHRVTVHILTRWLILCRCQMCRYVHQEEEEEEEERFGLHHNYDDEAQISAAICRLRPSSSSCQPSSSWRETAALPWWWWWSTNTSRHLSCFHVFDHFNYMLSAGERERQRARDIEGERERERRREKERKRESMPGRVQVTHVARSEWVREDTWWADTEIHSERDREQATCERELAAERESGGYIESERSCRTHTRISTIFDPPLPSNPPAPPPLTLPHPPAPICPPCKSLSTGTSKVA